MKLAVLPIEDTVHGPLAAALNTALQNAHPHGIDDSFVAKVSLEVVQLSIECLAATPDCYAAIGKSLSANRMLFAVVGKPKHGKQLSVSVTFFDVDGGAAVHVAERVFRNQQAAVTSIAGLVREALGEAPAPAAEASK